MSTFRWCIFLLILINFFYQDCFSRPRGIDVMFNAGGVAGKTFSIVASDETVK